MCFWVLEFCSFSYTYWICLRFSCSSDWIYEFFFLCGMKYPITFSWVKSLSFDITWTMCCISLLSLEGMVWEREWYEIFANLYIPLFLKFCEFGYQEWVHLYWTWILFVDNLKRVGCIIRDYFDFVYYRGDFFWVRLIGMNI